MELHRKKGDFVVAGLVLLLSFALSVFLAYTAYCAETVKVQVYRDGQLLGELPLDQNAAFTVEGEYENTLSFRMGRYSLQAPCVHRGKISQAGRAIVCLLIN